MILSLLRFFILCFSFLLLYLSGAVEVLGQNRNPSGSLKNNDRSLLRKPTMTSQDSENVTVIGRFEVENGGCYAVFVKDTIAYFGNGTYLEIADVSDPANPIELSKVSSLSDDIKGIYVSGNYAYIADGGSGLRVIDVSDPATP